MAGVFGTGLDAITWANCHLTNDMVTVCDADGDNAGTGPEDKRFAFGELAKRTLATADVTWLSTLAVSAIAQADDKFLVWDASDSSLKVITGSDLLNNTFAGASVAGLTALTLANTDTTADYFLIFDATATAWKKMLASELASKLLAYTTTNYTATPQTVTSATTGQRATNYGATQVIEFDLPAGATGLRYSFLRSADYAIRLDPNGSEIIGAGAAGKYLEITSRGQIDIEWINGQWEVTGGSALYGVEI